MRCRLRVWFKSLGLLLLFFLFLIFVLSNSIHLRHTKLEKAVRNGRKVASISAEDVEITYGTNRANGNQTNKNDNHKSFNPFPSKTNKVSTKAPSFEISSNHSQLELLKHQIPKKLHPSEINVNMPSFLDKVSLLMNAEPLISTGNIQQDLPNRLLDGAMFKDSQKGRKLYYQNPANAFARGYQGRVVIVNATLPPTWSLDPDLSSKLKQRKQRVKKVCHERGLDSRTRSYLPNAWEFVVSEKHRLVWCNVFKAASSTWFYNFNILAGYTESQLFKSKDTPISLARKKYPRIDVPSLDTLLNNGSYLSFMIVRNPFDRLVSGFRDKIETGNRFYRDIAKKIISTNTHIPGPKKPVEILMTNDTSKANKSNKKVRRPKLKYISPSFQQFVQYLLDSDLRGETLNEHWIPMSTFCTPCLVDFDVYAKVETLTEDGNYIIFTSGIEKIVKPKLINRSKNGPTEDVTKKYICSLSHVQKKGLIQLYQLDLDLFEYDYKKYFDCDNISK